jgi:hypothetical protein
MEPISICRATAGLPAAGLSGLGCAVGEPPRARGPTLLAWLLAWLLTLVPLAGPAQQLARESAVKAAFLYKFGSFVEWPAGTFQAPAAPFVIGIYGDDAVATELEQITQGRDIEGHPVTVQRLKEGDELAPLHILFVGGQREGRIREVLSAVRGPVLTVTEGTVGTRPGAVLFFMQEQGRVRFGASLPAAGARGLKLSAKLLAVAQQVEGR